MTIFELGALGEFVGGIAIIVTLIYLAVQVRKSQQATISATLNASIGEFNHLSAMLAADPGLAEILERGNAQPESLDDSEQRQYVWLNRCYINNYFNMYRQHLDGNCSKELWQNLAKELKWWLDSPGGQIWRNLNTSMYLDLYRYIDEMPDLDRAPVDFKLEES
jgi:hypothetical protein